MTTLRLAEEIMLLLLDDAGGKSVEVPPPSFEGVMAGAVLMDLALEGRIDTDPERLFVIDGSPLGDDLLDTTLARIVQSAEMHDACYWIKTIAGHAIEIRDRSLTRLVERGILRRNEGRFMWVFRARRFAIVDARTVQEAKHRIMGVLFSDQIPDARDIVLISLSSVGGMLESLLPSSDFKQATARIDQVRKLDLLGREVVRAVLEIESFLATADVPWR